MAKSNRARMSICFLLKKAHSSIWNSFKNSSHIIRMDSGLFCAFEQKRFSKFWNRQSPHAGLLVWYIWHLFGIGFPLDGFRVTLDKGWIHENRLSFFVFIKIASKIFEMSPSEMRGNVSIRMEIIRYFIGHSYGFRIADIKFSTYFFWGIVCYFIRISRYIKQ